MTDHPEFLRAILDDPDNDTPRLVYADWLEENGREIHCPPCYGGGVAIHMTDAGPNRPMPPCSRCHGTGRISDGRAERAEFIRVQCELARLQRWPCGGYCCDELVGHIDCEDPAGERREALRRRERELLADPSVTPSQPHVSSVVWRRGFIEAVTCTVADWHQHGKAVLAAQPVREVTLTDYFDLGAGGTLKFKVRGSHLYLSDNHAPAMWIDNPPSGGAVPL